MSEAHRAREGVVWTLVGLGASNVLRLASNLVLTRLLFPEAFGVMAIVTTVVVGLWLFTDVGIGPSVVQNPRGDERSFLRTAWSLQAARGASLALVCLLMARPIAWLYRDQDPLAAELVWLLPVAGLGALVDGLVSARVYTHRRHMRLRPITLLDVGSYTIGLAAMCVWAWVHPTVWALVGGNLVHSLVRTAASHLLLPGQRDGFGLDRALLRELLVFGRWIFLSTVLTFLALQTDRLVLGKLVSWDLLGLYGIAASLALLPTTVFQRLSDAVVFPLLSRRAEGEPEGFVAAANEARALVLTAGGAAIGGLLPAATVAIECLYDPRYWGAGWMLGLLLLGSWLKVLEGPLHAAILARGHTSWIAGTSAARLGATALFVLVGWVLAGLPGAILGLVGADAVKYVGSALLARRLGVTPLLSDCGRTLLLLGSAALGGLTLRALADAQAYAQLPACLAAGLAPWLVPLARRWAEVRSR